MKLSRKFIVAFIALVLCFQESRALADTLDDIACDFFDQCPVVSISTVVIVTVNNTTTTQSTANLGTSEDANGQRELMLQAATKHAMASVLQMERGKVAHSLVEYTIAQQLARRANSMGIGFLPGTPDANRPKDEVTSKFEKLSGMKEGDLYSYLSGLNGSAGKGYAAAQAAYADLLSKMPNDKFADKTKEQLNKLTPLQVAVELKTMTPEVAIEVKTENIPLPKGEPVEEVAKKTDAPVVATPSQTAPAIPLVARTPASVERGRRELEELWLFMSDEQSGKGELAMDVRTVSLFERVRRRYRVWELRRRAPELLLSVPPMVVKP